MRSDEKKIILNGEKMLDFAIIINFTQQCILWRDLKQGGSKANVYIYLFVIKYMANVEDNVDSFITLSTRGLSPWGDAGFVSANLATCSWRAQFLPRLWLVDWDQWMRTSAVTCGVSSFLREAQMLAVWIETGKNLAGVSGSIWSTWRWEQCFCVNV